MPGRTGQKGSDLCHKVRALDGAREDNAGWMVQDSRGHSRIVFLIENMSFPRDPRVRREASALRQYGCDVSVICPKDQTQGRRSFETIDNVKVYRYRQFWQGQSILGYLAEYTWAMACSFVLICWIWVT